MSGSHPSVSALMAKGIHLYKTENYVAARDYLNRGSIHHQLNNSCSIKLLSIHLDVLANNISNDDAKCLQLLADTHLKLHAFTLAEYCYTKTTNFVSPNYLKSLVEQNDPVKSQEVLKLFPSIENDSELTAEEKNQLTETIFKYIMLFFYMKSIN